MKPKSSSIQGSRCARFAMRFRPECLELETRVLPTVNILSGFAGFNTDPMLSTPDPPEPQVADGPKRLVETINFNIAFYDENGSQLNNQSLSDFWASLNPGQDILIDPSICYDELTNRFVFVILELDTVKQNSFIDLAVSTTDSPTSSADFTILQFNNTVVGGPTGTDRYFGDFPRLGYNADVYVVSSNTINIAQVLSESKGPDDTLGPEIVVFAKNNLAAPHPAGLGQVAPGGNANWQTVPARMHGAKSGDPMWLVEETAYGNGILLNKQNQVNEVSVVRMSNVLGPTLTLTNYPLPVDPYTYPSGQRTFTAYQANQPGGVLVPALGPDFQSVAYRNGVLAAADQVGNANDSPLPHVRWYMFDTTGTTPVLTQQGTLNPGAGVSTLFPAVDLDANGDLGMTYMQSSPTEYMSMYVTGRTPLDPPNTLQPGVRVQAGSAMWFPNVVGSTRAGDYSGISVDPSNPSAFWAANEYARTVGPGAANNYSTFVSHFSLSPSITGNSIVTGAGAGGGPVVNVFDAATGQLKFSFFAYDPSFTGGVRVAVGNVNGDGMSDVITAPGPGGTPDIRIFNGVTGALIREFFAFDPSFTGGCYVAAGDANGDGHDDIIVSQDAGGSPNVVVFSGADGSVLENIMAFPAAFTGGVRVAAGDVNGDGHADIIAGAGPGGGPMVAVFNGVNGAPLQLFAAFAPSFTGGVYVASADVNGDGHGDIIVGAGAGGGPAVAVFNGLDDSLLAGFLAYDPGFAGGVPVAALGLGVTGPGVIVTAPGSGGSPNVREFNALTTAQLDNFFAYDATFTGGVFVAGAR